MREKVKRYPIISFDWADALGNAGWFTEEEMQEWIKTECYITETGILVAEDKKKMVVAQRYSLKDEIGWGGLHQIPKTWIRKRKTIGWMNVADD